MRTLKGIHDKVVFEAASRVPLETHYLAYLRDTTFARLRTELVRSVGGSSSYPVQWIVPPPYPLLVRNAAVYLTESHDPVENLAGTFCNDITFAFDRAVFHRLDLDAARHLAFVFGSSGRRMKAHIRQVLVSALHRATVYGDFDFSRFKGGVSGKIVWQELVRNHSVRHLPSYVILEDLFLNDARQLIPKLELDPGIVTERLNNSDFEGLLDHIIDLDETSGTFGCLFNYFYQFTIEDGEARQPGILVLIRILQFVERNPRCLAAQVHDFLKGVGYNISEQACHFCLFVIIRTELMKWDASRGRRMIKDVPLYITTTGRIAIEKLLFSITYISEATLSSIMIDDVLGKGLRARVRENQKWIADCINNASISLYVIHKVEQIEERFAARNGIDLAPYFLYRRLLEKLSREASTILRAEVRETSARWAMNVERLQRLRIRYPDMAILGGPGR